MNVRSKLNKFWNVLSIVVVCMCIKNPLMSQVTSTEDAFNQQQTAKQFDQRGYGTGGVPVNVDGKLQVSTSNGNVTYSYPISSRTIQGFPMNTTLNYCGSVGFTAFGDYFAAAELIRFAPKEEYNEIYRCPYDRWDKFHQTRPAWILGFNGFAIQLIGVNSMYCINPEIIRPPSGNGTGLTADTENKLNWVIEGYDYCNRMQDPRAGVDQDVIKILRADGSVMELRNGKVMASLSGGSTNPLERPELYTGYYYVNETNAKGFAIVEYTDAYLQDYQQSEFTAIGNEQCYAFRPRKVRYYPGDGLEYIFYEWISPFGRKHYTYSGGSSQAWSFNFLNSSGASSGLINEFQEATRFGGMQAAPTIFYLEDVKDGAVSLTSFKRTRHFKRFGWDTGEMVDSTIGRAPVYQFDGHSINYSFNSMTIEALGRTITINYDSVLHEGTRTSMDNPGIPWGEYGNYRHAMARATQSVFYPNHYRSVLGMVTSIIDPEQRTTLFGYENYYRKYQGFRFPTDHTENYINLRNNRLVSVTEPASIYKIKYNSDTLRTLVYSGYYESNSPYVQKNITNIVSEVYKYARDNATAPLTKTTYTFSTDDYNFNLNGAFNSVKVYDYSTSLENLSTYSFGRDYVIPYVLYNQTAYSSPVLYFNYLASSSVSAEGVLTLTQNTYDTAFAGGSRYLFLQKSSEVKVNSIRKSYQKFGYSFVNARLYDGNTGVANNFGKEVSSDTAYVYAPDNITGTPLFSKTNTYHYFPLGHETYTLIDSVWQKYESIRKYYELRETDMDIIGKKWEEIMCHPKVRVYKLDTLVGSSVLTPPHYGMPTKTMLWDGSGSLLQGKTTGFQEHYASDGKLTFSRGLATVDTVWGKLGVRKITSGLYDYTKWSRRGGGLLTSKRNANGSHQQIFYDYNQPIYFIVEPGETCASYVQPKGIKLDNINETENIELVGGSVLYETPFGEQSVVRKYTRDTGGTIVLDSTLISQLYERGYFGQMTASVNPNGWYSRYTYDKNGRLLLLQLPGDFATANQNYLLESIHTREDVSSYGCTGSSYYEDSVYCNRAEQGGPKVRVTTRLGYFDSPMEDCSTLYASRDNYVHQTCPCGDPPVWNGLASEAKPGKGEKILQTQAGCEMRFRTRSDLRHYAQMPFDLGKLKDPMTDLDSVLCSLHITSVTGKNVNIMVEFPQLDTTIYYVLASTDEEEIGNGRKFLKMNLMWKIGALETLAENDEPLTVKVSVQTQGARVDFANDAEDSRPKLEMYGKFRDTYGLSDFTMKYDFDDDATPSSTITMKTDDEMHSSSSWLEDTYSRRWSATNDFGADYIVKKTTTRIGTPNSYRSDEITTAFTGLNQPTAVTDQDGYTSHTSYDALGRVDTVTNADNTKIRMYYDIGTPSAFSITQSDYYGFCTMQKTIDEKGLEVRQYSDALDRLRKEIVDSGGVGHLNLTTLYDYDLQGRLKKVTNPKAQVTDYWYDDFGRVKYKRQPDMGILSYSYDNVGNTRFSQTQEQSSNNKFTYYEYDDLNRVSVVGEALIARTVAPDTGIVTSDTLNLHRWTDELDPTYLHDGSQSAILTANKTLWKNLAMGIAVPTITQPPYSPAFSECVANEPYYPETFGPTLPTLKQGVFGYSPNVLPTTVANFEDISLHPEFVRSVIHYDELPTRVGAVWGNFTPVNRGGIWDSLAPKGKVRNLRGKQAAVAYRDKGSEAFHYQVYSYDERGRVEALLRFTENLGYDAVYYTYNSANQVIEQRVADPWRQTVTWYGYDWNGRLDTVSTQMYPNGTGLYHSMNTSLDSLKRPIFYAKPNTGVAQVVYSYTKRGMVDNMLTLQPGLKTTYTYNSRGFLDSLDCVRGLNTVFTEGLEYDVDGQITAQNYRQGAYPVATLNYDYDHRKQLTSWGNTDGHREYEYDNVGNRKSTKWYDGSSTLIGTEAYDFTFGTNRLASRDHAGIGSTEYSYYADGAMKTSSYLTQTGIIWENKVENFGYSYNGLLTSYSLENMYSNNVNCFTESGPFKWEWSYRYSPSGERESKRLTTSPLGDGLSSHNWNYYLLGGNKQQLAVYNGRETNRSDCYSSGHRVDFFASEYLTYGNGSTPLITTRPSGVKEYLVTDHLGSTRAAVNGSGTVINITDYEPFGKPLAGLSPRTGYIGKEKDYESDLADHGVRKYDYDAGIFRSIDPLWEKYRGWSPYQYSHNDPLRRLDPSGLADYVNSSNQVIGTDGIDDKKRYLTTTKIIENNTAEGKTDWTKVRGARETELLPSGELLEQMKKAIVDKLYGIAQQDRELGGLQAIIDGKEQFVAAEPGKKTKGSDAAYIDLGPLITEIINNGGIVLREAHSHGNAQTKGTFPSSKYVQYPDDPDIESAGRLMRDNIVKQSSMLFAPGTGQLIFYDGNGTTNFIYIRSLFKE